MKLLYGAFVTAGVVFVAGVVAILGVQGGVTHSSFFAGPVCTNALLAAGTLFLGASAVRPRQ